MFAIVIVCFVLIIGIGVRKEKGYFGFGGEGLKEVCGQVYMLLESLGNI